MSSQRLLPFLAVLLAGCAAQLPAPPSAQTVSSVRPAAAPNASPEAVKTKAGDYALSQEEQSLDCRKLTGRIHIRIAHMRDAAKRGNVSLLSRGLQTVVTPVFGGTNYGLNPAVQARRDRAQIDAYNRLLVAKECKPVDVEAELAKPE